ncbi:MAG: polyprenyl synthetase family protein [Holosporales bacterium]|jgi:octaprenyl-diphosphate synthase|nr:polyprenyl synthetase family protein [Holosporales bacterium]
MFSALINNVLAKKNTFEKDFEKLDEHCCDFIARNREFSVLGNFILKKGKRVRSILYFDLWRENTMNSFKKYETISLLEIIHFASIIHDDVIDGNDNRRGENSFAKQYGKKMSIAFGDFIFCEAIKEFLRLHKNDDLIKNLFLRECSATAYGAVLEQKLTIFSTFSDYVRVVSLKTSPFFKLCCFLGKYLSTYDFYKAKKAAVFGICFGIVFQAQNDINCYCHDNYLSSEDFIQTSITLPIIILRDLFGYDIKKLKKNDQNSYELIRDVVSSEKFKITVSKRLCKFIEYVDKYMFP